MAKMTLLEMTKSILNDMDSDAVNSIDDNEESLQVVSIIKDCYYDLIEHRDWPFLRTLDNLEGIGDVNRPTFLKIPEGYNKVLWLKYNKKDVTYLSPKDFVDLLDQRTETVDVYDANGYGLNHDPQYWTTYDDDYLVFDSINLDNETTLVGSKSKFYGVIDPDWTQADDFIPLLPAKMFPTLLSDAKGSCFLNLKQQANPKEETKATRGRVRAQNEAWRVDAGETKSDEKINYGRK